jgi:hypothetical protein
MIGVFFTEATFDGDADNDSQQRLVVLGFIAEDFEASLPEKEERICSADLFRLGIYSLDFRVDEFRHDDLAAFNGFYLLSE